VSRNHLAFLNNPSIYVGPIGRRDIIVIVISVVIAAALLIWATAYAINNYVNPPDLRDPLVCGRRPQAGAGPKAIQVTGKCDCRVVREVEQRPIT
jgi:hypothetical protein